MLLRFAFAVLVSVAFPEAHIRDGCSGRKVSERRAWSPDSQRLRDDSSAWLLFSLFNVKFFYEVVFDARERLIAW